MGRRAGMALSVALNASASVEVAWSVRMTTNTIVQEGAGWSLALHRRPLRTRSLIHEDVHSKRTQPACALLFKELQQISCHICFSCPLCHHVSVPCYNTDSVLPHSEAGPGPRQPYDQSCEGPARREIFVTY